MDRRIQKTRHSIMNAFIELLAEKGFEKTTINDIAERADINRGTVYLHYVDKFDLFDKCIEIHVERLLNHCGNSNDTVLKVNAVQSVFEYLEENFTIYYLLLSNERTGLFRNQLYCSIVQMIRGVIKEQSDTTIHFLTSGFIGVLEWWISNSMPCNVQELTEQFMNLLKPYANHLIS